MWDSPAQAKRAVYEQAREAAKSRDALADEEYRTQYLLARLVDRLVKFSDRERIWFVKGGIRTAVAAMPVRYSGELDLQFADRTLNDAIADLAAAANNDLGDFLSYELVDRRDMDNHPATRLTFNVSIGGTDMGQVSVDVSIAARMTDAIVYKRGLDPLGFTDLPRPAKWPLYSTVDQVADKVAATFEKGRRKDGSERPSTRYHDVVDLEIIAGSERCSGTKLTEAIAAEFKHRDLSLPETFNVPDEQTWDVQYRNIVNRIGPLRNRTLGDSLEVVRAFVDPALRGEVHGQSWQPSGWG